jgi:hypothetical protein
MEVFPWAFDGEFSIDRTFNDVDKFHNSALPDSENKFESIYAKLFKSNLFIIASPIVFMFLKFIALKYTNTEYLTRLIERSVEEI